MEAIKIAVASGKGGTGKSTISVNLALMLSQEYNDVALIDCDVEEPNCHIFLKPTFESSKKSVAPVPIVYSNLCTGCGKCIEICQFNVLALVNNNVLVFAELCHSCGGCYLVCPTEAIKTTERELGVIEQGKSGKLNFIHGKSRIGEPMSPPLIRETKKAGSRFAIQILDCPPGTSCPMVNSVEDADFVLMVTEPTPFGLYDLKLAIDVVKKLGRQFGIIINRSSNNDYIIEEYAQAENIKVIAKIADDRRIAEYYSRGEVFTNYLPEYKNNFKQIIEYLKGHLKWQKN